MKLKANITGKHISDKKFKLHPGVHLFEIAQLLIKFIISYNSSLKGTSWSKKCMVLVIVQTIFFVLQNPRSYKKV